MYCYSSFRCLYIEKFPNFVHPTVVGFWNCEFLSNFVSKVLGYVCSLKSKLHVSGKDGPKFLELGALAHSRSKWAIKATKKREKRSKESVTIRRCVIGTWELLRLFLCYFYVLETKDLAAEVSFGRREIKPSMACLGKKWKVKSLVQRKRLTQRCLIRFRLLRILIWNTVEK